MKRLLLECAQRTIQQLTGGKIQNWLPMELPKMQNPRVDLLGETADGSLFQLELQSYNDSRMPLRMAEYSLAVFGLYGNFPKQIVVYVGRDELHMPNDLSGPDLTFRYTIVDIRDLDGEALLTSPEAGDNVISVLTRFRNERETLQRILDKLAGVEPEQRAFYLTALLTLAGLRNLEEVVEEEARKMPILNNILDNKVLGREYKRGREEGQKEGRKKGREEGREKGRHEGELALLRRQIEQRFGLLPPWAEHNLSERSLEEINDLGIRVLDAVSLEDLLR